MGGMMGGGGPSIPQRNLSSELGSILKYLPKFAQGEFKLDQRYGQQFAKQDIGLQRQFAPQYLGLNLAELQKNIAGQPLLAELNTQAQGDLAAGRGGADLTSAEANRIAGLTRAGFAARGNALGNQAMGAELLNREQYATQRQAQRRTFAEDVLKLNVGSLGSLGGVVQPGGGYAAMQAGLGAAGQVANPLLSYGQDLYSSNQNAAATQSIAGANKSAGTAGGIMSTVGSIAGAVGAAY